MSEQDRSNLTTATLAELKQTAVYEHGELRIKLIPGHLTAALIMDGVVELWHAGNGSITNDEITMHRETWFPINEYPDWR